MPGEKSRCELYKYAACCFKHIPEEAPFKTAIIWSLTSHLTNHLSKTNQTHWVLLVKQGQTYKRSLPSATFFPFLQLCIRFLSFCYMIYLSIYLSLYESIYLSIYLLQPIWILMVKSWDFIALNEVTIRPRDWCVDVLQWQK